MKFIYFQILKGTELQISTLNALRLMGYTNEDLTAHGLRATFKTVCKEHQEDYKLSNEYV